MSPKREELALKCNKVRKSISATLDKDAGIGSGLHANLYTRISEQLCKSRVALRTNICPEIVYYTLDGVRPRRTLQEHC